ncbi:TetR/AcrR family transcriptional regulator [Streptomyces corynorhini]|uniref:TetR/AcrR family transcriptional regulator n=1 Tax=Streptomyces corynorhini TaxID=2282652 RepID=A0A370B880_9ACTN|nr:TetR family transcriptional regulator [Streptomyces corynorhini]RDG38017.1 TetR/AcrR family transcriptional regulator [Streptomyces corynorhini]
MSTEPLTAERILEATEEVLRRYGPAKATVVDVARVLGVSHGSVYRHFRTKAALREAVTKRWLSPTEAALARVISDSGREPGAAKLRAWLLTLFDAKRLKAGDDPELFATFCALSQESSDVVDAHLTELTRQLTRIIEEGVREGEFAAPDPREAAGAVFAATARFHDPAYAPEWRKSTIDAEFDAVAALLLRGLRA